MRFLLSTPLLFLLLKARGGRMSFTLLLNDDVAGLAFGTNLLFVFAAVQEATVSVLSTTVATQPALLLLLAGPIFGETAGCLKCCGLCRSLRNSNGDSQRPVGGTSKRAGVLWAVLALVTFSVYWCSLGSPARAPMSIRSNGCSASTSGR